MFAPHEFYKWFMSDHFLLKQATYKNILDNFDKVESTVLSYVSDYSKENYFSMLKNSMRMNYLHSIETLFELMFAIEKGILKEANERQDMFILQRLSASDYKKNFKRITKLANLDQEEFIKWDTPYKFKIVDKPISLLRYIFYFILTPENAPDIDFDKLDDSLKVIKSALIVLSKDFADRTEYNSYKHALRVLPLSKTTKTFDSITKKEVIGLDFDYSNTRTFILKVKNELNIITKEYDTERDFRMTMFVSDLIQNIISIRKVIFFNKEKYEISTALFTKELLNEVTKSHTEEKNSTVTMDFSKKEIRIKKGSP